MTSIGSYAFNGCTGLTELTIGNSVTSIGDRAFYNCTSLSALTIEDSEEILSMTTSPSDTPFTNCPIETLYLGRNLSFSGSSYSPFRDDTILTSLTVGEGVTNIPSYAFYGCTELTKLLFPDSVTTIGNRAFYGCSGLTALTIGSGIETISSLAFGGCSQLSLIDSRAATPPDITSDTFDEVDKATCVLNVPIGSLNAYWLHLYWGLFLQINEKDVGTMDAIGNVTANAEAEIVGYYTTDGKQVPHPQQGINIIRYSDGTVRKVLVK